MNGRRCVATAGALVLTLGLGPGPLAETIDLVAGGVRPEMFLVYTGDVIGYIDPCG